MKKLGIGMLGTCLMLACLSGCGSEPQPRALQGTVTVGGACAAEWSMSVILESFTFEKTMSTVTYSPSSSRYGLDSVANGTLDLGVACFLPQDLPENIEATPFAEEPIGVIVNADNPVKELTTEQLRGIFTGEINNWRQLGGADHEIVLFGRRDTSGTRASMEACLGIPGMGDYHAVFSGSGAIAAQVGANPYAIGYVSHTPYNANISFVKVDGVAIGLESLEDGSYPLHQTFYLLRDPSRELTGTAQAFLDFLWRADLDELVQKTGARLLPREGVR